MVVSAVCLYLHLFLQFPFYFSDLAACHVSWRRFFILLIFLRFTQFHLAEITVYNCYAAMLVDVKLYVVKHFTWLLSCPVGAVAYVYICRHYRKSDTLNFLNDFCCYWRFTFWQFSVKKCSVISFFTRYCSQVELGCILLHDLHVVAFTFSFFERKLVCRVYSTVFILHLLLNVCGWQKCFSSILVLLSS